MVLVRVCVCAKVGMCGPTFFFLLPPSPPCIAVVVVARLSTRQVSDLQRQDMVDLGNLILALACRHPVSASSRGDSLAFMSQHYSPELHNLAASLVSKPPTVFEVCMAGGGGPPARSCINVRSVCVRKCVGACLLFLHR